MAVGIDFDWLDAALSAFGCNEVRGGRRDLAGPGG
jgi:hypothetical protein